MEVMFSRIFWPEYYVISIRPDRGWIQSSPDSSYSVIINGPGQSITNLDFGVRRKHHVT